MKNYNRNFKIFISISMICLMVTIVMVVHINSYASKSNKFEYLKELAQEKDSSDVIEYSNIDISNISLETAVDEHCDEYSVVASDEINSEDYTVTGSISQLTTDGAVVENNESSAAVITDNTESQNNTISSGVFTDNSSSQVSDSNEPAMPEVIEIENWQELPGELSIKVNKQASCVTVYKGDTPIKAMICSAGESTPEGTFNMQSQWDWLMLIKGQYGRYCSQISGDYLFHSVPYNSMDIYDLDTEMYNDLGTLCSHGCIRLKCEDAKWIYDNCTTGTEITIYSDSNPGPLGKPGFKEIPQEQTWDPTDIDVE